MFVEQFVTVDSQQLNSVRGPERPMPMLLLHGVSRRWQTFLPILSPVSSRYEVFALDQRGHGRSAIAQSYYVADYVRDAVRFVRDVIGRPTVLYGHSLGGMVAAGVAAEVPELVAGLILEDPPFCAMGDRIGEGMLRSLMAGMQMYAGDSRSVPEIARDLSDVELHDPQTGKTVRLGDIRDALSLRFTARSLQDVDPQVFTPIVAGEWLKGYEISEVLRKTQAPTLLLQADTACGGMLADDDVELIRSLVTDLTHLRIPGVGHLIMWAMTERILNLIWAFTESLESPKMT